LLSNGGWRLDEVAGASAGPTPGHGIPYRYDLAGDPDALPKSIATSAMPFRLRGMHASILTPIALQM
jgi:hypothetical protein